MCVSVFVSVQDCIHCSDAFQPDQEESQERRQVSSQRIFARADPRARVELSMRAAKQICS